MCSGITGAEFVPDDAPCCGATGRELVLVRLGVELGALARPLLEAATGVCGKAPTGGTPLMACRVEDARWCCRRDALRPLLNSNGLTALQSSLEAGAQSVAYCRARRKV